MTCELTSRIGSRKNSVSDTGPLGILLSLVIKDSITLGFLVNNSRRKFLLTLSFGQWGYVGKTRKYKVISMSTINEIKEQRLPNALI